MRRTKNRHTIDPIAKLSRQELGKYVTFDPLDLSPFPSLEHEDLTIDVGYSSVADSERTSTLAAEFNLG